MEEYERLKHDERLVDLINLTEEYASTSNIIGWIDSVPEMAEICIFLFEETNEQKYKDILTTILCGIDGIIIDVLRKSSVEDKEKFNILRLKLLKLKDRV